MKSKITIITEGQFDSELLKRILPISTNSGLEFDIVPASGFSYAMSLAKSILIVGGTLLLVLDTDSHDEKTIAEKKSFVNSYLNAPFYTNNLKLVWAVPELEIIFFEKRKILERIFNKPISEDVWALAGSSPKKTLEYLLGKEKNRQSIIEMLVDDDIKILRETTLISEIIDFSNHQQSSIEKVA
jgi:hypothetical protein